MQEDISKLVTFADDLVDAKNKINEIFGNMRMAVKENLNPNWQTRFVRLDRLESLLLDNQSEIEDAICVDFAQRSAFLTDLTDVLPTIREIRYMKDHGEGWMKPRRKLADWYFLPATAKIVPQPKGIVGIICPWNYPLLLSFGAVAQAFAAGNLCMVKLSEKTPVFSSLMQRLAAKYFLPTELSIINGEERIGEIFSSLPFDHLLFTGSVEVGRKVAQAAAGNLTPVTLELGGKSPAVIAPGYPIQHAAERIIFGKLLNAGQTCIAPDYVMVERKNVDQFTEACCEAAKKFYPDGIASEDYCSIISPKRFDYVMEMLKGVAGLCQVEPLFEGAQSDRAHRKIAPQLLIDPPLNKDSKVMGEEIFAPLLPVVMYHDDNIASVIDFISRRDHPLAVYWFDKSKIRRNRIARIIKAGGITFNDTLWHAVQTSLPFGGIGTSGMGRYMGQVGFETFSNMKPIFVQHPNSLIGRANPPYTQNFRKLIQKAIDRKKTNRFI